MDNDHEDSTFSTNKFNSSRLLVQACSSQSQTQKVQILQRKNSKNSAPCYHDKDCTHASQNTDFNFKR